MKNTACFLILLLSLFLQPGSADAQTPAPIPVVKDTVKTGIYITSIHDIDFKDKDYSIDLWLWLRYKNRAFDFLQNLEIPQAKTVTRSFSTVDTTDTIHHEVYVLMKLQCQMKDSWKINNFPFDHQKLTFSIENSQFESKALVFVADTLGKHFDPRFTLRGWTINTMDITTGTRAYETAFGDKTIPKPHTEYSTFKVKIDIGRDAMGLFWKMFLGMYVAFLIAYICFYIHNDNSDSRFALSVGALFAVVGNKYIIDSALPESTTFTLVDTLHGTTLVFILGIVMFNAMALKLIKKDKVKEARRLDLIAGIAVLALYIILNIIFIANAAKGG